MKLALVAVVGLLAAASSASATPPALGQQVQRAATRARFGGEVAVTRHGRIVFARGFGLANRARRQPVTLDTAFNLASMGKMFTGVAAAQLVQAGKLRFGYRIGRYLPHLPARLRALTVAELLDHTSGLGDFFADPGYERLRPTLTTLGAYLPLVTDERLKFKPDARWSYSNSGFLLAGLVIEKASGEPYAEYLARRVWKPAGMRHTGCFERAHLPRFAVMGHLPGGAADTSTLPPIGTSAGGCYSSARDLLAFARALETGRLVSRKLTNVSPSSKGRLPAAATASVSGSATGGRASRTRSGTTAAPRRRG
jgi:D-alanyl-D-alanine carboxypeptidase